MASKFILVVKDGAIVERAISKPQAPRQTLNAWLEKCAAEALGWRVKHYAFRHSGKWHVLSVDHPSPIKSFSSGHQAAAEMFLMAVVSRA